MSPSRLHWPSHRGLFHKRGHRGLGATLLLTVVALAGVVAFAVTAWPA